MGELEDTRKEILYYFMGHRLVEQLMKAILMDCHSLTVVIQVNIFGLLLFVMVKDTILRTIVLVPLNGGLDPPSYACW